MYGRRAVTPPPPPPIGDPPESVEPPPKVSEEALAEARQAMGARRAARRGRPRQNDMIGSRSLRTCPPPQATLDSLPPPSFYPEGSAGRYFTVNLPYCTPVLTNPDDHEPKDYQQMKVPASEWAFHIFTQGMHQEVAPWNRPIAPMPCGHVPRGLCDDCPGCIWYTGMDQRYWG